MLVLTRKAGESIQIGEDIRLTILSIQGQNVKMGILAPREVAVHREEIYEKIVQENRLAASRASIANAQTFKDIGGLLHAEEPEG